MYIADLHIHSRYSRATSKDCTPEHLDLGARRKGIHLVGTGDFTHPAWREELREKLVPAEDGLYVLKEEYQIQDETCTDRIIPRFVITGEISSIYKKNGRVRKVHSLILLPGLEEAEVISRKLEDEVEITLLGKAINKLSPREQTIIRLRFGLNNADGKEKTQKEVADLLGISQSYISRLEKRIMKRLKKEIVKYE